jgi:hypothetical protein
MNVIDYGFSFVSCNTPENSERFWIESRTRVINDRSGATEDYVQCASCKSEDTFAKRDLFQRDNWDFMPIFGPEWGVIFRRKAWLNPNYKSVEKADSLWGGQRYHLVEPRFRELGSNAEIRRATREWLPIVAQTEIRDRDTGLRAILEYPVKTMNIHHEKDLYQTDTGPLAFPDLTRRQERTADGISLAFCAFNAPDFADFVIEEPTPLEQGGAEAAKVYHYSRIISLEAANRLYAIER